MNVISRTIQAIGLHRRIAALVAGLAVLAIVGGARAGSLAGRQADVTSPTPSPSAAATSTATPTASVDGLTSEGGGGGGKNIVIVQNRVDSTMRARGGIQLNHIHSATVAPANIADAYSSCTGCGSLAVALQINLVSSSATDFTPQNAASAVNYQCTHCVTIAVAYQYTFRVTDPDQVPPRINQLIAAMRQRLNAATNDPNEPVSQMESEVSAVINDFSDLAYALQQRVQESDAATDPGATAAPTDTASPSVTATASPSATPSDSPSPSP
jgi:putative peptide zinc metalloprotease protein